MKGLWFHQISNDSLLCYSRRDELTGDTILVVVALEPSGVHWGETELWMPALGLPWTGGFEVVDLLSGETYHWHQRSVVAIAPISRVAHVMHVQRE
jgi:starch synthase (maltosyl-transferring)